MHTDVRKLHLIEAILKTRNNAVLDAIETIVENDAAKHSEKKANAVFSDLLGTLSVEEAEAMKSTIKENFEQINPDDWK